MPAINTRGGMSAQAFGWTTSIGKVNFIGLLGVTSSDAVGRCVAIDSSDNVYMGGYSSSTISFQIAKYNKKGVIQWQKALSSSSQAVCLSIALDSSGNVYACGYSNNSGTYDLEIAKYDTSGTLQWQRVLGRVDSTGGTGITIDGSGNIFVCGYYSPTSGTFIQLAKYDSSGTIQWKKQISSAGNSDAAYSIALDSSGNIYICGSGVVSGQTALLIVKCDSTGSNVWQRTIDNSPDYFSYGQSVTVDSSGNVYVCGSVNFSGNSWILAKYNSSGTIQWQRVLTTSGVDLDASSIILDSSSNIYVCGTSAGFSQPRYIQIAKYDSSGSISWQRKLSNSSTTDVSYGFSIKLDNSGNFCVLGYFGQFSTIPNYYKFLFAKLPTSGALTGTYTVGGIPFTYAASSQTDVSSGFNEAAYTLTTATSSLTDEASTLTDAASSLTSTVKYI
jgi:hypothetical protein